MLLKPIFITIEINLKSFCPELKRNHVTYTHHHSFCILIDINFHDMSTMKFTEEKSQHFCCACPLLLPTCTCESIARHLLREPLLRSNHKLFPSKFSDDHVNDTYLHQYRNQSYPFYPELKDKHVNDTHHHSFRIVVRYTFMT